MKEYKRKLLVVVDMQNDFVDGSLGTKEAQKMLPNVVKKIEGWDGDIILTKDTHYDNYCATREGKFLPVPHCLLNEKGWFLHPLVSKALNVANSRSIACETILKESFGTFDIIPKIREKRYDCVEFIGLCTDICVISNALIVKNAFPELDIFVDASCCAGVTPESHKAALLTMKMCQIEILNEE